MRRGWLVIVACVAALSLASPVAQAVKAQAVRAQAVQTQAVQTLPGPLPGCPSQPGIPAPARTPWPQRMLDFSSVWDLTRGAGVIVAVVDSGVDANPQFGHRVIPGPDLAAADPAGGGRDGAGNADCVGHGTSMASIIAAAPVTGISFAGVAPEARILSVKISNSDTFPTGVTPQAIRAAVLLGASVINLSLATADDVPALRSAVEFALRSNVVVVAAVGNDLQAGHPGAGTDGSDGSVGSGPFYPAAYPGVLSVAAVGPGGSLASFSDRRTPVSVTAPGVNVTSAYPGTFPDAYNPAGNGTSFAAAFVSGVVALVRSYHPRLDEAQVVARIEATADGGAGPGTGYGLVNPVRAVTAVLPAELSAAAPAGQYARTVIQAVSAGSFGLMIVVMTAVLVIPAVRRRRPGYRSRHAG